MRVIGEDERVPGQDARFRELVDLERQCAKLRHELGTFAFDTPPAVVLPPVEPAILSLIAKAATDFLSVHAADGVYVFASPSCFRLFGWEPSDMIGRSAYDFFHADDIDPVAAHHASHAVTSDPPPIVYRLRKRDGDYTWVETRARAFRSEEGVDHIVCITQDVSERRALMAEKERLIAELEERLAQIKTLSGLLPICAWCKSVRDDEGFWDEVERYVSKATDVEFTHSICPSCAEKLANEEIEDL